MSGCSGGTSLLAVKERASQTLCSVWKAAASMESLNRNLEHLRFGGGDIEDEDQLLESLNGILQALAEDKHRTSSLLSESEVLPAFARYLQSSPHCGVKAAQVLAEIAKNEEMKTPCIDAGLVPILIPLLDSTDQEMLLHVGRAIGRICYDNNELQEQLVAAEVIRSLVRIMLDYPDNEPLVRVNLLALSNLADLDTAKDALSKTRIAEHLVHQLRKANHHEKVEIILEVLQTLAENDVLKLQLAEAGIQDAVAELLLRLQDSSQPEDMCSLKAASDLIVSLLLGVANKVQMLNEGVSKRIQMLLRSEMPPVQFKLLGTLRMLMDGQADAAQELGQDPMLLSRLVQWCDSKDHAGVCGEANRLLASLLRHSQSQEVVKAIQDAQGVKHLVSMATSEHVIMQNEALIALAIASAINLEIIKAAFKEAKLVQNIHKLLQDESTGPEVKYNSIGLLCSLFNSGDLRQEAEEDKVKETLEKLCGHINGNVAKQALMALQILNEEHSIFEQ
ncbi:rap1 GTPase-GDP dissociation stimulator 1-like isoform X9 [Hemicordylus capensis]|uniref:rap1 GTPase-GDP dissociation stimulator 1-like isoform X9 n=1 Tax=Hemicordylus capensis TaxID=884348 RepID=UPI0023035F8F|nr:rap1 GTPase-GDP dissociation stimulator 1-like isoform X9 [Hemicordylus capensis]